MQRLYGVIVDSVHVTDAEVRERYRIDQEKINLNYIRAAVSDFTSQVKLSDDDIKKFYDRNKESLKEPLKLQSNISSIPIDQFTSSSQVSDKEIEEYYQANLTTNFISRKKPKCVTSRVRVAPDADAKQKTGRSRRAERHRQRSARRQRILPSWSKRTPNDPSAEQRRRCRLGGCRGRLPPPIDKVNFYSGQRATSAIRWKRRRAFRSSKSKMSRKKKPRSLKEASGGNYQDVENRKAQTRSRQDLPSATAKKRSPAPTSPNWRKRAVRKLTVTNWFAHGETLPEIGHNQDFYKSAFALSAKETEFDHRREPTPTICCGSSRTQGTRGAAAR